MTNLPLAGIRVVEFCQVAAGPFCSMLLADMGADVIKVESPDGDTMRQWPPLSGDYSENFASVNRNKRSIVLDLKHSGDLSTARSLIDSADVLIENSRPGVMDRLGLGYATVSGTNPKLIYCSISAFGQSGPRSREGGFDLTLQGIAGVMSVTGAAGAAPVKCGVPISDFSSGLYGAFAIASLLTEVARTGKGAAIDISMMGATLAIAALQTSEFFGSGRDPRRLGSAHPRNAPYQAFRAADGYFVMAAGNDKLWGAVCEVLGRPELHRDPNFATTALRSANQSDILKLVEDFCQAIPVSDALQRFTEAGVPCGPINSYSSALEDAQVRHMGWVQPLKLPNGHQTRTFGTPITINGEGGQIRRSPPALGEHTSEIMLALTEANSTEENEA